MSDAIMTAKHVIRLEAFEAGIHASFMPRAHRQGAVQRHVPAPVAF